VEGREFHTLITRFDKKCAVIKHVSLQFRSTVGKVMEKHIVALLRLTKWHSFTPPCIIQVKDHLIYATSVYCMKKIRPRWSTRYGIHSMINWPSRTEKEIRQYRINLSFNHPFIVVVELAVLGWKKTGLFGTDRILPDFRKYTFYLLLYRQIFERLKKLPPQCKRTYYIIQLYGHNVIRY